MFASEVVLARWQAAEKRLAEAPKGTSEADELRALAEDSAANTTRYSRSRSILRRREWCPHLNGRHSGWT